MKLHHVMNLMIYVCRSSYKYFSSHTWSNFVRFDFSKILYAMDWREHLTRERSSVCVKEKKLVCTERERERTTQDKVERKCVCVFYANISRMHLWERKQGEEIHEDSVRMFATERERPLARGQERSGKQGERLRETYGENGGNGRDRSCLW
jgi:hypothetical protein